MNAGIWNADFKIRKKGKTERNRTWQISLSLHKGYTRGCAFVCEEVSPFKKGSQCGPPNLWAPQSSHHQNHVRETPNQPATIVKAVCCHHWACFVLIGRFPLPLLLLKYHPLSAKLGTHKLCKEHHSENWVYGMVVHWVLPASKFRTELTFRVPSLPLSIPAPR